MTICSGLNVVELGAGSTGASIAGMVLADAGARVVKVEPPEGDRLRDQFRSAWLVYNRGKESAVADLRTAEGQAVLRDLAATADVVIDGLAPGVSAGWGVGAADLCEGNPRLVHCSITAFGPSGPWAQIPGYDTLVAAKVGLAARGSFGHRDGPLMYPVSWGGFGAGLQSVAGILGALMVRDATGRGQRLDATMVGGTEPLDYFVNIIVQLMLKRGEAPNSDARSALAATRYGVVVASLDGRFIATSTMLPHQAQALTRVAGLDGIIDEPRFAKMPMFDTPEIAQEWEDLLIEAFRAEDLDHWRPRLLDAADVAFEIACTSEEGLDHAQIVHNGDSITVEDDTLGPIRQVGPIGHFSATPLRVERSAPRLGANAGPFTPAAAPHPAAGVPAPAHPFSGITIVEFGYFYAMPYGLAMAAALGARVIKIEDGKGDPHRSSFGPEVASTKTTAGKESLSIDLTTPEGQAVAQRVIAGADVFATGFRTGVADKLGLGYEALRQVNPRLLYIHAAGYGSDGPMAKRALYAQAAQTVGGSFGRQVGYWSAPENNVGMIPLELQAVVLPRLGQVVDGDSNAALGVLAALSLGVYHQRRTGQGQFLSTSMIAGNAWAYSDDFCAYEGKEPVPLCDSEYLGVNALCRNYEAAGGSWATLVVVTGKEWAALAGHPAFSQLAADERFSTAERRAANDDALAAALATVFATATGARWEEELTALGVGCVAPDMRGHATFLSTDDTLLATGLAVEYEHPVFGTMRRAGPPVAFSETPGRVAPPCLRGEHNHVILEGAGYSPEEIKSLESAGIVIPPA